jgi:hypothetical protein
VKKAKANQSGKAALKRKLVDLRKSLSEFLSGAQLEFVMSQLRDATRKAKGARWTSKDKALALSLLHSSPKTYRILRKTFAMPSIQTLKRSMYNVKIYPGFNDTTMQALRMKTAPLPAPSKLVVLAMDEMAIKEGLSYDSGRDVVEGFSEGLKPSNELANHAMVFMVRGIMEKWKQAIGYFLSSGPMGGKEMEELVRICITKLHAIGLTVILLVSDQGSNNQHLFQSVLGITAEKPFFYHDTTKVFVMYDPPHLLKNIRNNFKKHGYTIHDNDIMWTHLKEFYEKDCSKPIRMAPRLTRRHIELPPFAALRVSLATQVLSHSVASGMAVMAQWNIIAGLYPMYIAHLLSPAATE